MQKKKKAKTIRAQIFHGYIVTTMLTICLVITSVIFLYGISRNYLVVANNREKQMAIEDAMISHYKWLEGLSVSIQTDKEFSGSLDASSCDFGKWLGGLSQKDLSGNDMQAIQSLHQEIHNAAKEVVSTSKINAQKIFYGQIEPEVQQLVSNLSTVSAYYKNLADAAGGRLLIFVGVFIFISIILGIIVMAVALSFANRTSKRISKPIAAVAQWSESLSLGMDNLQLDITGIDESSDNEVGIMVRAFKRMTDSIKENVNVMQRVANGDMTAFVNIRSSHDSLGKNIYKMVQSNDLLFAEILEIAQTVANASEQIAHASQGLAQTSSVQASSVHDLSKTIKRAGELIEESTKKTVDATDISEKIKIDAEESSKKMELLVGSVNNIRESSEKISLVIKSIEDIAFQTNILALNAAIEAARAGQAGNGFAAVADEVRNLALKSAQAAEESKTLIENTIYKTQDGTRISGEASEMFHQIVDEINQIVSIITDIASMSSEQLGGIQQVRAEIEHISQATENNASVSEQSAAASKEMSQNAALLKEAMSKFNLRQRKKGSAYIPPEKQNDPEFIRRANENYQKSLETGKYGFEYIEEA